MRQKRRKWTRVEGLAGFLDLEKLEYSSSLIDRDKKVFELMDKLNKLRMQGSDNVFDCGDLGFVRIHWTKQWEWRWIEVESAEEFLSRDLGETN